ncbi:MAG: hypothetical protein WC467_02385 [Patescibacteria group bacterium]
MKHLIWLMIFAVEVLFLTFIDIDIWQKTPKDYSDFVKCIALGAFAIVAVFAFIYHMGKYLKKQSYKNLHY